MDIVLGGGKFGLKAVKFLMRKRREFLVLDRDPECEVARKLGIEIIKSGTEKLVEIIEKVNPEWIFPTAPIHVVAEAVKDAFEPWEKVIDCILSGIPPKLIVSVGKGGIVLSYNRDGICIENCTSPEVCPVTRVKRPCPMFEVIRFACPEAIILVSHQIAPSLGTIKGLDFLDAVKRAEKEKKLCSQPLVTVTA
jgi:hypothetical protein